MLKNLLSISHWRTTSDSHNIPDNQSENNRNFELYAGVASDGKIAHLCWLRRNIRPAVGMAVVLATGMIFSFWWNPLFQHSPSWFTPSDLWNTFRAAQYVTWGGEGTIYASPEHLVTFPGIAILLSPIAALSSTLHLTFSFPLNILHPTTWYVLGPANLAGGGLLLFPLEALAQRLSIPAKRRTALLVIEILVIWPSVAIWGHPEDALAVAFAIYGLMAAFDRSWTRLALYFAVAVVMQPLTVLVLPIAFAIVPLRQWPVISSIIALPSLLLLLPPLIQHWSATTYVLLKQPNYPAANHPTPWYSLAPILQHGHYAIVHEVKSVILPGGRHSLGDVSVKAFIYPIVAAGPGRIVAIALSFVIGVLVAKKMKSLAQIAWLAALALSLRCIFECVMVPYYLTPALALALVTASKGTRSRFAAAMIAALACLWSSYFHWGPWTYYTIVTSLLLITLFFSWPGRSRAPTHVEYLDLVQEVTST